MQLAQIVINVWLRISMLPGMPFARRLPLGLRREEMYQHTDNTIIIGGGVIGLSTAYYIALLQQQHDGSDQPGARSAVVVIDSSTTLVQVHRAKRQAI